MGRGLLAGLGAGGVVSVLGLGALSVLAPLPGERAVNNVRGGDVGHAAEQGVPRAAPGPLAVPEPAPTATLPPDTPHKPTAPQRIEAPKAPELAQPPLPQADPMAAEPATPQPAVPQTNMPRIATPEPRPPAPAQDADRPPVTPSADITEPAPAAPARPLQMDATIVAPASETAPAARPQTPSTPATPAAPLVQVDDGDKQAPTAESSVPVPPPGAARAPDLVPATSAGQPARVPAQEIILTPGMTVGPLKAPGPIILLPPAATNP